MHVDEEILRDLHERLKRARWNDAVQEGWAYGTDRAFLRSLAEYWSLKYDWRSCESSINTLPMRRVEISGLGIVFIHYESQRSRIPLLLLNGWPSSFLEYSQILSLLHSNNASPFGLFDLVIPSMPGFGFSDRPERPWQIDTVDLFLRLMRDVLGYKRFLIAGTDIGAGVATRMALKYPESLMGIHITSVVDPPGAEEDRTLTSAELAYVAQREKWNREEGAYEVVQCTRPQTLAFGLADSPIGLASWIIEKFYNWTDCRGDLTSVFPFDALLDNIMIYWVTGTIGSSVRYYYESRHFREPLQPDQRVSVPTAVTVFPKDLVLPPREWAERFYNVTRYSRAPMGGHFPAWEAPRFYACELANFARDLTAEGAL